MSDIDWYDKCQTAEAELLLARAEIELLRAALLKFADHFGPLEDNKMLHPEARECFRLARRALAGEQEKVG